MNVSRIVEFYDENRKYIMTSKLLGWICRPFCCLGMICLSNANDKEKYTKYINKVVEMYTRDVLISLAPKVINEHKIFLKACNEVNTLSIKEGRKIYPYINLIDVISVAMPIMGCVLKDIAFWCLDKNEKEEYLLKIYKKYIELGGNTSIVVYGLPEYIAIVFDLGKQGYSKVYDEIDCEKIFKMITCETQLHEVILSCKEQAGWE